MQYVRNRYYTASSSVTNGITLGIQFFSPGSSAWWWCGVTGCIPTSVKVKSTPLPMLKKKKKATKMPSYVSLWWIKRWYSSLPVEKTMCCYTQGPCIQICSMWFRWGIRRDAFPSACSWFPFNFLCPRLWTSSKVINLYLELNTSKTKEMGCNRVENREPSCAFLPPVLQAGYTSHASTEPQGKNELWAETPPSAHHVQYVLFLSAHLTHGRLHGTLISSPAVCKLVWCNLVQHVWLKEHTMQQFQIQHTLIAMPICNAGSWNKRQKCRIHV